MSLTVLNVAFPLAPVGPDAVGGAEQVLTHLDAGLVRAGHQSIVIACDGSCVQGLLIRTRRWTGSLDAVQRRQATAAHRAAIAQVLQRDPIDLVHFHGIDFYEYLPPPGVPVLVTLHLPPEWYPSAALNTTRPNTYFNCVSASQRRRCRVGAVLLDNVENGVPDDLLASRHSKRNFALSLGRICPEKGFHIAVDAAKQAGSPLLLAGEVFPYEAHQRYFESEIMPRLDRQRRFIGPIGWRRKRRLLSAAQCLLVPSLVAETSSLVAMEALACGTPVIGYSSGALPEIVEPGKTGFIVHTPQQMAEAIQQARFLSRQDCRESARRRFSSKSMLDGYLNLYRQVLERAAMTRPNGRKESHGVPIQRPESLGGPGSRPRPLSVGVHPD